MTSSVRWLTNYKKFDKKREVMLGANRPICAVGLGDAVIPVIHNGKATTITLNNVLHVPKIRRNLISMSQLMDASFELGITPEAIIIRQGDSEVRAERRNGLYILTSCEGLEVNITGTKPKVSLKSAHSTYAHINVDDLRRMLRDHGYEVIQDFTQCTDCVIGKQHRASYKPRPEAARAPRPGFIHTDVCSVDVRSLGGSRYFVSMIDDFTSYKKVYFMKSKDEVPNCI